MEDGKDKTQETQLNGSTTKLDGERKVSYQREYRNTAKDHNNRFVNARAIDQLLVLKTPLKTDDAINPIPKNCLIAQICRQASNPHQTSLSPQNNNINVAKFAVDYVFFF